MQASPWQNACDSTASCRRGSGCVRIVRSGADFASSACRDGLGIFSHGLSCSSASACCAAMPSSHSIPSLTCLRHRRSRAALSVHPLFPLAHVRPYAAALTAAEASDRRLMLHIRCPGPRPRAEAAIEGSQKLRFSPLRMAVLERIDGFQAPIS